MSGLVDMWTSERARLRSQQASGTSSSRSSSSSDPAPTQTQTQSVAKLQAQEETKRSSTLLSSLASSKLGSSSLLPSCSEASVSALVEWFSP